MSAAPQVPAHAVAAELHSFALAVRLFGLDGVSRGLASGQVTFSRESPPAAPDAATSRAEG